MLYNSTAIIDMGHQLCLIEFIQFFISIFMRTVSYAIGLGGRTSRRAIRLIFIGQLELTAFASD